LPIFDSPWKKKGSLLKKNSQREKLCDPSCSKESFFKREREKKNSLEKCCKLFMRAQNSLMLLPNSRNACHMHCMHKQVQLVTKSIWALICCTKKQVWVPIGFMCTNFLADLNILKKVPMPRLESLMG
jgi:hypothetical protein